MIRRSGLLSSQRPSRLWAAFLGALLAISALAFATPARAQAQTKIGVVDMARAVAETEDGLRAASFLQKLHDQRQGDLEKLQVQLQKDQDALNKDAQAGKLPKEVLQKKYDALQKSAAEYQQKTYEYEREMARNQAERMTPIKNKILEHLKNIAQQEGYSMIVEKSVVYYSRGDLDLTDRAIQMYNAESAAAKGATDPKAPAQPAPKPGTAPAPTTTQPAPKPAAPPAPAPTTQPAPKK